ncbi:ArsR/SmtB family transcription factor [Nocardioides sp. Root151]|uniref:ArsR/SmtB family transcription factor n=2 Tax=Nocardioides TaxID=1839 RepID=UPI0006FAF762|nr:metalloregulator ArsR/SmtB family transcription factor [Nocardioides sp. Root151]KQY57388.1 ArsR family transcriptional regulator [Nocardioides sp. Root140]KQZ68901.1 ArsR family transcriptional regulator [Nocardioides sp. Root151]KRF20422.1 ArsR family transcriptional regulator [Nocardioides sp. Soil796]
MTAQPSQGLEETTAARAAACLFRGMGDPSRVAILRHLLLGEHNVTELTTHLGLAQSTVSKHLACLRDCGLVESRPAGRASVFSLTHPDPVLRVFAAAEELLAATGDAVVLCPTYGEGVAR